MGHTLGCFIRCSPDRLYSTACASAPEQDAPAVQSALCTGHTAAVHIYQRLPDSEAFVPDVDTVWRLDGYR